jgi:hypothetical protein
MKDATSGIGLDTRVHDVQLFWAATSVVTGALAGVLLWFLHAWPPHEDEALALFVGRGSLGDVLHTVVAERGGAPLHFLFAWAIVHAGGGLTALRVVSVVFAVASVPLIVLLGRRLTGDRTAGIVAALLASATWVMLFHGIYGRMYSLFLFTSLLSFLALLARRFALWGLALLALLASHPYAVLVIAAQVLFALVQRVHRRKLAATLAAVGVLGIPFWWADVVLRDRFDVGVGGGGPRLGSVSAVLDYLRIAFGDLSAGHDAWAIPVVLLSLAGAAVLARTRPAALVLTACVVAVPTLVFLLVTLRSTISPESRHLIFVLPFVSMLLAVALVAIGRMRPPLSAGLAAVALTALLIGEVAWAHDKTPALFDSEPAGEPQQRDDAARWLASTGRADDVLLGYEPIFLRAWEDNRSFSRHALPRADPVLLADALRDVPEPLGRGVWVFDASDTTNVRERQTIRFVLPPPASAFEGHVYGPYLVIRSRRPLLTRARFLTVSEHVMRLGRRLRIGDADVNLQALRGAESRL